LGPEAVLKLRAVMSNGDFETREHERAYLPPDQDEYTLGARSGPSLEAIHTHSLLGHDYLPGFDSCGGYRERGHASAAASPGVAEVRKNQLQCGEL
jgi:hypothetical protein